MITIDYSQLSTYQSCPRKYYNKYIRNLKKIKIDESDTDKDFGGTFHKALELLYKGGTLDEAKKVFRQGYACVETEKAKTPQNGEKLVEEYWNYWQKPTSDLSDTNLTTVAVESVDSFKITEDIEYQVKIDRIVKAESGIWVLDHKTSSKKPYNYFYQFDPNMQVSGYVNYCIRKHGQCSGMIVDLAVIGYREKSYKGEPAGFHCEFVRDIVNRNKEQIDDFERNVVEWIDMLNRSIDINSFPKNESNCGSFKGCQYRQLCSSCDDEGILDSLYEQHNPKEYLEGGQND